MAPAAPAIVVHARAVEMIATADLVIYARNPRTHSSAQIEKLAAVIADSGFTNPLLIDEANGVIAGHGRLLAAARLGLLALPCVRVAGLTEEQTRALRISDNALGLLSEWDKEMLAGEILALEAVDFDLGLLGLSDEEIATLLIAPGPGYTDPDDAPPVEAVLVSEPGDIWLLGPHRLACGNCTDAATVAALFDTVRPHLMVTDPPYGVEYDASWRVAATTKLRGKARGVSKAALGKVLNDDQADWRGAWALFPGSVAYVWHAGTKAVTVAASLAAVGLEVRAQIVWIKPSFVLSRGDYHQQFEPAFYALRPEGEEHWNWVADHEVATYVVEKGEPGQYRGGRKQSTVWFIENPRNDTGHSTQKPVDCMRRPIENNSGAGEAVYDPFVGSGTTLIAAQVTGRICYACELSPAYVDVAVRRWQNFTQADAVLEATGQTFAEASLARLQGAAA